MDTNDDLHLSIPLDPLKESFSCPICMCLFSMTTMTPCGHRYCEGCILEWIDRKRKCPCCNAAVHIRDLIRDTGFDSMVQVIVAQKNKVEDAYFAALVTKCIAPPENPEAEDHDRPSTSTSTDAGTSGQPSSPSKADQSPTKSEDLSPVERILRRHIKVGIIEHEKYYRSMKAQFQKHFEHAKGQILKLDGIEDEKSQEEKESWILKKRTLQLEFQKCTKLLVTTYDRYLSSHLPTLSTLPVTVFFRLYGKDVTVGEMILKPHFSMADIKEMVFTRIREKQDRIAVYREENIHYLLVRPYSKGHVVVDEGLVFTLLGKEDPYSSNPDDLVCLLPTNCIPVLEYGIQPGSDVVIFGDVKLRSELPKPCFTALFEEGEDKMDYFTCKDCSFNWVCRSCKDHCHKDHETTPYVLGHQPTWACCYCPRKKKCLLRDPGN